MAIEIAVVPVVLSLVLSERMKDLGAPLRGLVTIIESSTVPSDSVTVYISLS